MTHGGLGINHQTVWQAIVNDTLLWLHTEGRFFPVTDLYGIPFANWANGNSEIQQALQIASILINLTTMYFLARRIAGGSIAAICTALVIGFFQVRLWYDPIAGWPTLMQITVESTLMASLLWLRWFDSRRHAFAVGALIVQLIGMLSYEVTYGLAIATAFIALTFAPSRRMRILSLTSIIGTVGVLSAVDIMLRRAADHASGVYAVTSNAKLFSSFLLELFAAIPLSYASTRPGVTATQNLLSLFSQPQVQTASVGLLAGALGLVLLLNPPSSESSAIRTDPRFRSFGEAHPQLTLFVYGALLMVIPAAIISLSPRWQAEVSFGLGYLPVYIEYFGLALLVAIGVAAIFAATSGTAARTGLALGGALLFGCLVYVTAQSNQTAYRGWLPIYTNGRLNVDRAIRGGLLDHTPDGATIMFDGSYLFPNPQTTYLLYQDTNGRTFQIGANADADRGALCIGGTFRGPDCRLETNLWQYRSTTANATVAWVQAEHFVALAHRDGGIYGLADEVMIYATTPVRARAEQLGAALVREADGGAIYDLRDCLLVRGHDLRTSDAPHFVYGKGFYASESSPAASFRWAGSPAYLDLINDSARAGNARLHADLGSLAGATVTVDLGKRRVTVHVPAGGARVDLPVHFEAHETLAVTFATRAVNATAPGDPRTLALRVSNARLASVSCSGAR